MVARHADEPVRVLGLTPVELSVAFLIWMVLYMFNYFLLGVAMGYGFVFVLRRIQKGKNEGYFFHMLYRKAGIPLKGLIPPYIRQLEE